MGFMLYAGQPEHPGWWLGVLPFVLWSLIPYALLAWTAARVRDSRRSLWVLLVASVLLTGGSGVLLYQAFVARPDAQSGLVFLFLPVWQVVVLAVPVVVAHALGRRGSVR